MTFPADLAKLAYEQASKQLTAQVATVDNARTRFGVLLGGGNVATAFLGKDAIANGIPKGANPELAFLIGIGAFAVFVVVCLYGILPRGGWNFDLDPDVVLNRALPEGGNMTSMEQVHTDLAKWLDYFYVENDEILGRLYGAMVVAAGALFVEFLALFYVIGNF
jgi:hypothetical protein